MRGMIWLAVTIAIVAPTSADTIHFYFSTGDSLATIPQEYLDGTVPTVLIGDTVYLWAFVEIGDAWKGISLEFQGNTASAGQMYNPVVLPPVMQRWNAASDLDPVGDNQVTCLAVLEPGLGNPSDPLQIWTPTGHHFLVGEVAFSDPNWFDVYLAIGPMGMTLPPLPPSSVSVYFGFDPNGAPDGPLTGDQVGATTGFADLTIGGGGNMPPVANAGPDRLDIDHLGDGFEDLPLDGSGSYDPDGFIVEYRWTEGGSVLYQGPDPMPLATMTPGVHTIQLRVEDDMGDVDFDTVVITLRQPGDADCDGSINAGDIDPFVLALTDPAGYAQAYPDCERLLADIDGDGSVNAGDIDPFVILLVGP